MLAAPPLRVPDPQARLRRPGVHRDSVAFGASCPLVQRRQVLGSFLVVAELRDLHHHIDAPI